MNMFAGAFSLDVSPDGKSLVFGTTDEQNRYIPVVCDLPACTNRRSLAAVPPGRLRWTPDGRAIAYISPRRLQTSGCRRSTARPLVN